MEPLLQCNLCDHRTDSFSQLRLHLNTIHTGCKVGYECFFCAKMGKTPFNHRQHLIKKHGEDCDLAPPPPTGRMGLRNSAQLPNYYLPPFEARLAPNPPKRRKSHQEQSKTQSSDFDWESELNKVQKDDLFRSDSEDRMISRLSPMKKDFGVQVRKRDFLTTSRDTQMDTRWESPLPKTTSNSSTQTISIGVDDHTQTDIQQVVNTFCQTIIMTTKTGTQANFFNAGAISHTLMDNDSSNRKTSCAYPPID